MNLNRSTAAISRTQESRHGNERPSVVVKDILRIAIKFICLWIGLCMRNNQAAAEEVNSIQSFFSFFLHGRSRNRTFQGNIHICCSKHDSMFHSRFFPFFQLHCNCAKNKLFFFQSTLYFPRRKWILNEKYVNQFIFVVIRDKIKNKPTSFFRAPTFLCMNESFDMVFTGFKLFS